MPTFPTPRSTIALTRTFFPSARRVSILFYLPNRKICTHSSLRAIPLPFTRRIGTSLLASSTVMRYLLGSPRPEMCQSTLTSSSAIGTSLYRPSPIGALNTRSSNSRDPMCRDADNSRSRSLGTSLLARSSPPLTSEVRDADIRNIATFATSCSRGQLTSPSAPDARDAEMPICRSTSRAILP
jgi:hypothetical protein